MTDRGRSQTLFVVPLFVFFALIVLIAFGIPKVIGTGTERVVLEGAGVSFKLLDFLYISGFFISVIAGVGVYIILYIQLEMPGVIGIRTSELMRSRDFFLKLFDDSPVPYFMVDKSGFLVLPNKAGERLFQMTAEELRTFKFHQLIDPDYFLQARTVHDKFERGVGSFNVEVEIIRNNNTKRWVLLSALPYRASGGKGKGGTISMFDITEQKSIEKVKTELVSLASHQLRTPLTAMKWYCEMLLRSKGEFSEKQMNYINRIYFGNERMIELVNALLSASRLELGSLNIDIENVDPVAITKEILEEVAKQVDDKGLHVVENYTGDATNYYTDRKLMHMILQNLITNAVKYNSENGDLRITMRLSNENMYLEVADSGMGIPEEQQDKIFSKMFRADNARLQVTEGTGLGLYIVKEAIEALGGEISFTSKLNEGTIFKAVVPNGTHGSRKLEK